jgi:chromosome segregation ATPase
MSNDIETRLTKLENIVDDLKRYQQDINNIVDVNCKYIDARLDSFEHNNDALKETQKQIQDQLKLVELSINSTLNTLSNLTLR